MTTYLRFVGPQFDFYVDSVGGSDSNTGTQSAPFASLAKLEAAITATPSRTRAALKRGSYWRESLTLPTIVASYGTGAAPVIDGASVVTGWTPHATAAHVFEKTVSQDAPSGAGRLTVYENGVLLTRVADLTTCSSTAGSFVDVQSSAGASVNIQIHPKGDTTPGSDGKTYEVSVRMNGINLGAGTQVTGPIQTQRVIGNDGSLVARSEPTISKVLAAYGTKHNVLIGTGTASDTIAYGVDPPTSYEPSNTVFVAYANDLTGKSYTFDRCGVIQPYALGFAGVWNYSHDATVSTYLVSGLSQQCWIIGNVSAEMPLATASYLDSHAEGCYVKCANMGLQRGRTTRGIIYSEALATTGSTALSKSSVSDTVAYIEERTGASNFTSAFQTATSSMAVTFANCVLACGPSGYMNVFDDTGASGTLSVNKTVFWRGGSHLRITASIAYTGDYNIFMADNQYASSASFIGDFNGSQYLTLSAWQTASGQDAHSVILDHADQTSGNAKAFWLGLSSGVNNGPIDGDFRINPNARCYSAAGTAFIGTYADGTTLLTSAGAQTHWDWNAKASAAGALTRWPVVPQTLADAQTYIADPSAWNF